MFSHSSQSPLAACLHLHLSQISYYSTVLYFGRNDLHQQVPDLPFDVGSENGPRPDEMREMEEIPGAISMFRFLPFEWLQVVFLSKKEKEKEGKRKRKRGRGGEGKGRGQGTGREEEGEKEKEEEEQKEKEKKEEKDEEAGKRKTRNRKRMRRGKGRN